MRESDPRVLRTKEHIKQCFFELLEEKPADQITVKELCQKARCSRNTFYVHFQYRDNLFEQLLDDYAKEIAYGFRPLVNSLKEQTGEVIEQYMHNYLEGVYKNIDSVRAIIKSDKTGYFQKILTDEVYKAAIECSKKTIGEQSEATNSEEWQLICRYTTGGFVAFVTYLVCNTSVPFEKSKQILLDIIGPTMFIGEKYLKKCR